MSSYTGQVVKAPNSTKNQMVVYTCCFGNYAGLRELTVRHEGCDYICFTDNAELTSDSWRLEVLDAVAESPLVASRHPKILPHHYFSDYRFSLYVDANIAVAVNPLVLAQKYLVSKPFWVPKHFQRGCLYDEAVECAVLRRATTKDLRREISEFRAQHMPKDFGLSENGVLLREHNRQDVIELMEPWWALYVNGSLRDQISLPVALWKSGACFSYLDESVRDEGAEFTLRSHSPTSERSLVAKVLQKVDFSLRRLYFRAVGL